MSKPNIGGDFFSLFVFAKKWNKRGFNLETIKSEEIFLLSGQLALTHLFVFQVFRGNLVGSGYGRNASVLE